MRGHDAGLEAHHPWTTYAWAREEARVLGDRRIGSEHLLLGLLHDEEVASVLGVSLEDGRRALEALDRDALATVGIHVARDVPRLAVRDVPARPSVASLLRRRMPLTPSAATSLREAGRPMRKGESITPRDVLARLAQRHDPDPCAALFRALGVDASAIAA